MSNSIVSNVNSPTTFGQCTVYTTSTIRVTVTSGSESVVRNFYLYCYYYPR